MLISPISKQRYLDLPEHMFAEAEPATFPSPSLLQLNEPLLAELGLSADWFRSEEGIRSLSGAGEYSVPTVAMGYSGHQFGGWAPVLGDGRAHMLGQVTKDDGQSIDIQLKGSGRTPFSRGGDGRATLGAVIREYLVSEAMAGLDIPTTRSLAVVTTGESIRRETMLPGAILVRTAASHIRVGSFEYADAHLGEESVRALADFVISEHFPECAGLPNRYVGLLDQVVERQASLIARWMLVGFIHGVMNTDNTSLVGETIDYGPCAFIDEFHPHKVFSSIDRGGRYAWSQQPQMAYWNLIKFAGTLMPLINENAKSAQEIAKQSVDGFEELFHTAFTAGIRRKLGIPSDVAESRVQEFTETTLTALTKNSSDFTVFFDQLSNVAAGEGDEVMQSLFEDAHAATVWLEEWRGVHDGTDELIAGMRQANPKVIARNHRVEEAIDAATHHDDPEPFRRLVKALKNPHEIAPGDEDLQLPPQPEERVLQTFCGT